LSEAGKKKDLQLMHAIFGLISLTQLLQLGLLLLLQQNHEEVVSSISQNGDKGGTAHMMNVSIST
jgi:hypothetical protein